MSESARKRRPTRRGRPAGGDSEETRRRLIDVSRRHFATRGYAKTAMTMIAKDLDLAPSVIYHYFANKAELYEAVYEATSPELWHQITVGVEEQRTLVGAVNAVVQARLTRGDKHRYHSDFMAMLPIEARLHPEFRHLLDLRSKNQYETFGKIAEIGFASGELAGFTPAEAVEMIRCSIMGWFFESHFSGDLLPDTAAAVVKMLGSLRPPTDQQL